MLLRWIKVIPRDHGKHVILTFYTGYSIALILQASWILDIECNRFIVTGTILLDFWWCLFIARQRLHVLMDVAVLAKYLSK